MVYFAFTLITVSIKIQKAKITFELQHIKTFIP